MWNKVENVRREEKKRTNRANEALKSNKTKSS